MHLDSDSTIRSSHPSAFNALKHGCYAESILLPGEDAAAFRRERRALFHNYRPQTQDEADLVDVMAEHRWGFRRYRAVQARFDAQALAPFTDAAGRICEPDGHRRLHSGMDVAVHRKRVESMWHRARAKLVELQKLRRQGLVAGAVALPKDCYLETDGRVLGPVARHEIAPIPEPDIDVGADRDPPTDNTEGHPSADGEIGKYREQQEMGREAGRLPEQLDAAAAKTEPLPRTSGGRMIGGFGTFTETPQPPAARVGSGR